MYQKIALKMLLVILGIALYLGLVMSGCAPVPEQDNQGFGEFTAPDFQLQNLQGETISLGGLQGSPVLINFWATWCPPCRSEMPYIQEIYEDWADEGLVVLAVNIEEDHKTAEEFMQDNNLSFTVLLDESREVAGSYGISGIPTTFFVGINGMIQDTHIGAFSNTEQIESILNRIIP
ncbi:peroxiredoxin family protein [Chloroflexota bacterium]